MGNSPSKDDSSVSATASSGAGASSSLSTSLIAAAEDEPSRSMHFKKQAQLERHPRSITEIPSSPRYDEDAMKTPKQKYQSTHESGSPFDLEIGVNMAKALSISKLSPHNFLVPTSNSPENVSSSMGSDNSYFTDVSSSSVSPSTTPPSNQETLLYPIGVKEDASEEASFPGQSPPLIEKPSSENSFDLDAIIETLVETGFSRSYSRKFKISGKDIKYICASARKIFLDQPMLLELASPVKVVGDIHGQFHDLLRVFKLCGFPPHSNYLFLGDYVDRGKQSLETILLLLCLKIKYPENFFMLRGNHESANVTKMYGFYDECKRRSSLKTWKTVVDVFNALPVAATISDKIFCVHGGLSPTLTDLDQIRSIRRPTDIPESGLLADLLWSDPDSETNNWSENDRGVSYCFGKKTVTKFCQHFNFDLVARGHMVVEEGYEFFAKRKLVTVFSAPNYCGEFDNWGAVMSVNKGLMCSFDLLKPTQKK
ncbi:unnamed protein product [Kuraishia capsulata CBS 1993]|uniref:Serine/threonine-protein phosphatase n=1 Tax=Kuraishia capsulata CBS 1993 TaxID=1382522 RepID=W6MXF7_9ASCO|nr:uncharacterized protein KUCA_T00004795001 [Kuraishia capsulata CBS 1993]CDK28810.1 unnamed protein product [Kuraishia capsulata CBS 1993]